MLKNFKNELLTLNKLEVSPNIFLCFSRKSSKRKPVFQSVMLKQTAPVTWVTPV